ncbi:retrovirus-related pol polyprotein from transposon TNT 1-94 [Tanacetum coccineum]
MKGLSECKASESNIRRIRVKDIVKEVEDYLKTYSSAGMDISWRETQYLLKARQKFLTDGDTLVSESGIFELGFFQPGNSENKYLGIRYKNISVTTLVWVANKDHALPSASSNVLKITNPGKLSCLTNTRQLSSEKGKNEKEKSEKSLLAESFYWDDESVSSDDEGSTKIRAFMTIAEDEPSIGKADARSGQWVDITMKKVHRILSMTDGDERKHVLDYTHVDLHYVEDQRKNLKKTEKSPTGPKPCSDKKADSSTEQLLLTLMEEVKGLKRQIEIPSGTPPSSTQPSSSKASKQKSWFRPCTHCGFRNHLFDDCYSKPKCSTCGSTNHLTKEHLEHAVVKKTLSKLKAQSPLKPHQEAPKIPSLSKITSSGLYGPKVVFGDDSLGDTKGYISVNCYGITFTKVAYVNGVTITTKDKLSSLLPEEEIKMESLNEVRVKEVRSDNGTEFRNHKLEEFCDENGISQNFSSPCTPEQNGVAERRNRTLIEAARTMLNKEDLLIISFSHCCFGCPIHIHNHKDHLGKFDEKADDGFFLGYSLVAKAFRVFNIRRQEMEETVHVTFSEDDEAISQSSTEGDAINFNENRSFLDDEFIEPRNEVT